jgi:hypothetical protein
VRTDYTSLFGGAPRTQSAGELIDSWRALAPGFDATQHLTGPMLTEVWSDTARARCAVTAVHRLGREHWTVSGHYDVELIRMRSGWAIGTSRISMRLSSVTRRFLRKHRHARALIS